MRRLRTQIAVTATASTTLLWVDNLSEHYRGGFRRKLMYVPIVANPFVTAAGAIAATTRNGRSGKLFGLLSATQTVVAAVGSVEHQRAIVNKPGNNEPRQLLFNAWYGPPVAAPLQYLGLGLMGVMATVPNSVADPVLRRLPAHRLMRAFTAMNIPPVVGRDRVPARARRVPEPGAVDPGRLAAGGRRGVGARCDVRQPVRAHRCQGRLRLDGRSRRGRHRVPPVRAAPALRRLPARSFLFNWLNGPPAPAPLQRARWSGR